MFKSTQNKLLLALITIGTIILSLLGYIYIQKISDVSNVPDVINVTKKYIITTIILFISMILLIAISIKKGLRKTMISFVKDAGKIVTGEETKVQLLQEKNRQKSRHYNFNLCN